jgi:ATP-binding cassette subfamily B protein
MFYKIFQYLGLAPRKERYFYWLGIFCLIIGIPLQTFALLLVSNSINIPLQQDFSFPIVEDIFKLFNLYSALNFIILLLVLYSASFLLINVSIISIYLIKRKITRKLVLREWFSMTPLDQKIDPSESIQILATEHEKVSWQILMPFQVGIYNLLLVIIYLSALVFAIGSSSVYLLFLIIFALFITMPINIVLRRHGTINTNYSIQRTKNFKDSLNFLNEMKLTSLSDYFLRKHDSADAKIVNSQRLNGILNSIPRLFIQFFLFSLIVIFVKYLPSSNSFDHLLDDLLFIGLTLFRVIPAMSTILNSLNQIFAANEPLNKVLDKFKREFNIPKNETGEFHLIKFINPKILMGNKYFNFQDITIAPHKRILIKGPSGSGKTSLARCISGLTDDFECNLSINNKSVSDMSELRKYFVFCSQEPHIMEGNLLENIFLRNIKDISNEDIDKASSLLKKLKLSHLADKLRKNDFIFHNNGQSLSGGEKQRIAIIRTLLYDKPIKIFDEPISSLDKETGKLVAEVLSQQSETLIIISHQDLDLVFSEIISLSN